MRRSSSRRRQMHRKRPSGVRRRRETRIKDPQRDGSAPNALREAKFASDSTKQLGSRLSESGASAIRGQRSARRPRHLPRSSAEQDERQQVLLRILQRLHQTHAEFLEKSCLIGRRVCRFGLPHRIQPRKCPFGAWRGQSAQPQAHPQQTPSTFQGCGRQVTRRSCKEKRRNEKRRHTG